MTSGTKSDNGKMQKDAQVQNAPIPPLQAVRPQARLSQAIRPVQDLLQGNGAQRPDSRRGQGELVNGFSILQE